MTTWISKARAEIEALRDNPDRRLAIDGVIASALYWIDRAEQAEAELRKQEATDSLAKWHSARGGK